MKKSTILTSVAAGLLLVSQASGAAVFDFIGLTQTGTAGAGGVATGTYASGGAYNGTAGEAAFTSFTWVVDGVSLTASGSELDGSSAYAYLDSGNAGLGVCSSIALTGNSCAPSNDDNLDPSEILHLVFDFGPETVSFADTVFRNATHNIFTPTTAEIRVDGGSWAALSTSTETTGSHLDLGFSNTSSHEQLYLSSLTTVPEPASLALLGLGLFGLGMVQRKKNKS